MKLNITIGGQAKNGYFNIDPTAKDDEAEKTAIPLDQLDKVVDDSECTEIILENILQYIKQQHIGPLFNNIIKKIRHRGKLILIFDDINVILKHFLRGAINLQELNDILYNAKQSTHTISSIEGVIKGFNLSILSKELNQTKAIIIAQRN
jgi:hypothetical protein